VNGECGRYLGRRVVGQIVGEGDVQGHLVLATGSREECSYLRHSTIRKLFSVSLPALAPLFRGNSIKLKSPPIAVAGTTGGILNGT
jgi:hypothetical protein